MVEPNPDSRCNPYTVNSNVAEEAVSRQVQTEDIKAELGETGMLSGKGIIKICVEICSMR
jgi:hypothetical protein